MSRNFQFSLLQTLIAFRQQNRTGKAGSGSSEALSDESNIRGQTKASDDSVDDDANGLIGLQI